MKTLTAIAALSLCFVGAAHAQMDQSQSQDARAALNGQEAAAAQQQVQQNVANENAADATAAAQAARTEHRDMAYDAAMEEHHDSVRAYRHAMRQWRRDVAACQAGDRSRCDTPMPNR